MVRHDDRVRRTRPWWQPLSYSAAAATAIAALFHPLPASAAPEVPAVPPAAPAVVPDPGSRPIPLGTLVMPGQAGSATPTSPVTTPGIASTPLLRKLEAKRTEVAKLGDQLIKLGEDRDLAQQQVATAQQKASDIQAALIKAKEDAAVAAAAALREQAALPPGTLGSGLADLDALSRMQRGESATEEAAARQLAILQGALTAATAEQATSTTNATDFAAKYTKLNAQITKKQAALQKLEQQHADEISAAEAAESATDRALGEDYLRGAPDGRGADPRAIAALEHALDQIGDPYVWSEEGPDQYDCSGLMYASYRRAAAGNYPLQRVSRDQYWQTHRKTVDRYSLLPGDLLFFSSSSNWQDIHHVAMYAGEGKMVEAPRTGLSVRLVPVRWSRLFSATRIYGSVEGATDAPDLDNRPAPGSGSSTRPPASTPPSTRPTSKPPTSTPPTTPTSPSIPPSSSSTPPSSAPPSSQPTATPSTTGSPQESQSASNPGPSGGSSSSSGSPSGGSTSTGASATGSSTGSASPGGQSPSGSQSASDSASRSSSASTSASASGSASASADSD